MRSFLSCLLALSALLFVSCGSSQNQENLQYGQLDPILMREVKTLGNRNWIIIADESFPLDKRRGVRTLLVDKEIPEVLRGVIDVVDSQQHVAPIFYRSRQLATVKSDSAPMIDQYRNSINKILQNYDFDGKVRDLPYRIIAELLKNEPQTFAVLVIKTKTKQPYSSIFIELENNYWSQTAERELRSKMTSR